MLYRVHVSKMEQPTYQKIGPYSITDRELGEGSNGKVKIAIHELTGALFAVPTFQE
jgi:hypothetical protein